MNRLIVDTSSILDALLDRSKQPEFRLLVERARHGEIEIHIPEIALFELQWVLQSYYKKDKAYVLSLFRSFFRQKSVVIENKVVFDQALELFSEHEISLEDARICALALTTKGSGLVTSDKKLQNIWKKSAI